MNWEAVGAIGEVLGAVGVIATLAYLSVQVRQNTRAIRGSTLNAVTQYQQFELRWSADNSSEMLKAIHTPDEMSEDDVWKVSEMLTALFVARQNEYSQYNDGLLTDEDWRSREGIIRVTLSIAWVRHWWRTFPKETFNSGFVERVEKILGDVDSDFAETLRELGEGLPGPE